MTETGETQHGGGNSVQCQNTCRLVHAKMAQASSSHARGGIQVWGVRLVLAAATGLTISTSRCAIAGAVECPRRSQPRAKRRPDVLGWWTVTVLRA